MFIVSVLSGTSLDAGAWEKMRRVRIRPYNHMYVSDQPQPGCGLGVRLQGAASGCGLGVRLQGEASGCGFRVQPRGVASGCGLGVRLQGEASGCGLRVWLQGATCISLCPVRSKLNPNTHALLFMPISLGKFAMTKVREV